jgi:hypothetical protein
MALCAHMGQRVRWEKTVTLGLDVTLVSTEGTPQVSVSPTSAEAIDPDSPRLKY